MAQEFFIKSEGLEQKVREILPSQGGLGAGFDLSASTQIVPIVDLTESAEGSNVRADLQSALSFKSCTQFFERNSNSSIITNTGTFRITGNAICNNTATAGDGVLQMIDASGTSKTFFLIRGVAGSVAATTVTPFEFLVKLEAGESVLCSSGNTDIQFLGTTRQIASLDGTLIDP